MTKRHDRLTFIDDNRLQVNGRFLWASVLNMPNQYRPTYEAVMPRHLETVLRMGATAINERIESFYRQQRTELVPRGYTVTRPSIWVAQLGTPRQTEGRRSQVYSAAGYANGGVHFEKDEQRQIFWPYWEAVERAGFVPHVRGSKIGAWLMLRNDDER